MTGMLTRDIDRFRRSHASVSRPDRQSNLASSAILRRGGAA